MSLRVRIQPFDHEVTCSPDETILVAALRAGVYVPYGCKTGGCSTCKMRLVEGEIDGASPALAPAEREEGWFLPCVTRPRSDCVVDTSASGLDEQTFRADRRPAAFTTELVQHARVTSDVHAIRLQLIEPARMRFAAGQFIQIEVPGSSEVRAYSIASPPSQADQLDLFIRRRPGGRFSGLLENALAPGARLRIYGPYGQLRVRLSHRPIIMIGSGSGVAPMLAMLSDLAERGSTRPVRLLFRVHCEADLFARERLAALTRALPSFELITVYASDREALRAALVRELGAAHDHDAYISGSAWCIETALPVLEALGVRRRNIYFDVFTPAI